MGGGSKKSSSSTRAREMKFSRAKNAASIPYRVKSFVGNFPLRKRRPAGRRACPVSISWLIKVVRVAIQVALSSDGPAPEIWSPNYARFGFVPVDTRLWIPASREYNSRAWFDIEFSQLRKFPAVDTSAPAFSLARTQTNFIAWIIPSFSFVGDLIVEL